MKKLLIVDSHSVLFKSYFAFIKRPLRNSKGMNTSALYGFLKTFFSLLKKFQPDHMCFAFDKSRDTFRRDLYKEYKAHRSPTPDDLVQQLPYAPRLAEAMGALTIMMDDYEADDLLGSISHQLSQINDDLEVYLITGDRDSYQLIKERVFVGYTSSKATEGVEVFDIQAINEKYGLRPIDLIPVKALMGDSSDNIPGVRGVGEKTAIKLIKEWGDLENLYANIDQIKGKLKNKLEDDREMAYLSRDLARIKTDIKLPFKLENLRWDDNYSDELRELLIELEFYSIEEDLFGSKTTENNKSTKSLPEKNYKLIKNLQEWQKLIQEISSHKDVIAFDCETSSLKPYEAKLVGIALSMKAHTGYYIPLAHRYLGAPPQISTNQVIDDLHKLFSDESKIWIAHNLKYDMAVLRKYGLEFPVNYADTMIQSKAVMPDSRRGLKFLAENILGETRQNYEDLVAKDMCFSQIKVEDALEYAASDADNTLQLYNHFEVQLDDQIELQQMLNEIEYPLIQVLESMESTGVNLDTRYFEKLGGDLVKDSESLKQIILRDAGCEFNLNSTKQLAEVLYDKLGLPSLKQTKTGRSTATGVLERLVGQYPICAKIIEYRHLTKLLSTYVKPLPEMVDKHSKLHTNFGQAITATGRLSSTEPNLQNIPVRSEWGTRIRRGFLPSKDDWKLCAIDYSQIELRIMAELSGDQTLIEAFKNGRDIHQETASKIYEVRMDEVSKGQRESAKAINFGIIYGISAFGLSQQLDIPIASAKDFIDSYFRIFPQIYIFMNETSNRAMQDGYVSTMFGRKRPIAEFQTKNKQSIEAGKRIAVNTRIQGTAAEIIKIAMNSLHKFLHQQQLKSRLILQVHDELIFEMPSSELNHIIQLKEIMEKVCEFEVPIICDVELGDNWGDLENYPI
ncbi:MAG: DNA polymerase I [bacterium]|nr:DNA polymerase I [bacterium]